MMRTPAVAGQFYPGEKSDLEDMIHDMMPSSEAQKPVFGIMSPHAGYVYSGRVAGITLSDVDVPDEVIIIGPNHHGYGHAAAVYARGSWRTPLGDVPIAEELTSQILKACPFAAEDPVAHRFEHSLEVQLPFLQMQNPRLAIAPICLGHLPLKVLLSLGEGLAKVIQDRTVKPLIVASTDMTHYESGQVAKKKDKLALDRVLNLDPEGLFDIVRGQHITMCGVLPVVVMLQAAVTLGCRHADLIDYRNSGEVTGDQSEVVGYAGVRVY